jgi:hypothetical protein
MAQFSERIGAVQPPAELQIDGMSDELRKLTKGFCSSAENTSRDGQSVIRFRIYMFLRKGEFLLF